MTACDKEDYPYEPMTSDNLEESWRFAIGLQEVDGLRPSKYLRSLASDTIEGEMSLDAAGKAIRTYYKLRDESGEVTDAGEREADLVSQRITELLTRRAFIMAPSMLAHIHRHLFQDLDDAVYAPGSYKTDQLVKREYVLNGDSVLYGAPEFIDNALTMFFAGEASYVYGASMSADDIGHLV